MINGRVVLLGAGRQGIAALHDLYMSDIISEITVIDIRKDVDKIVNKYRDKVNFINMDVSDKNDLFKIFKQADIVIDLLPSHLNRYILESALEYGIDLVNASYLIPPEDTIKVDPEDFKTLDEYIDKLSSLAENKSITILPEFGLDPGIDLVLMGEAIKKFDEILEVNSFGAGLPEPSIALKNPLHYKITWNFEGVLKSYKRPARIIRNKKILKISPDEIFSKLYCRKIGILNLGILEAYPNGDTAYFIHRFGLLNKVRNATRLTLRWPGHCSFWYKLIRLGFLEEDPIDIRGVRIRPIDFIKELLEPKLVLQESEKDLAFVMVSVKGIIRGKKKNIIYQILDYKDPETGLTAMSRTTGFTVSIGAQLILRGEIKKKGLIFPGSDVPYQRFIEELKKRGIKQYYFEM